MKATGISEENYIDLMWNHNDYDYGARLKDLGFTGGHFLDLGCGPGQWSLAAASHKNQVVSVDANEKFISYLKVQCERQGVRHLDCYCQKVEELQVPGTFEFIMCYNMLQYVDANIVLKKAASMMVPQGKMLLSLNGPGYYLHHLIAAAQRCDLRGIARYSLILVRGALALRPHPSKERYHLESSLRQIFRDNQLRVVWRQEGGMPADRRKRFLGFPFFVEFLLEKE